MLFPPAKMFPRSLRAFSSLHGQIGFWRSYRHYARQLARLGFGVLYINYYSARYVNLKEGLRPFDERVRRFRLLLEDIARGVDALAAQSVCDPQAISVAGFSLGGSYAFHIAAMRPKKVAAVVSFYGGYRFPPLMNAWDIRLDYLFADEDGRKWHEWMKGQDPHSLIGKFRGPVLLFHGTFDNWIPFEQAEKFQAALLARGVAAELVKVPGQGHDFMFAIRPDPGQLAIKKMVEFLERRVVAAACKKNSPLKNQQQNPDSRREIQFIQGGQKVPGAGIVRRVFSTPSPADRSLTIDDERGRQAAIIANRAALPKPSQKGEKALG